MKIRDLLTITALALGLLFAPAAFAGDDGGEDDAAEEKPDRKADKRAKRRARREARKKFNEGAKLTGEQKYEQATEAFRAAYELDPLPDTLYNLATVYRLAGSARKAYEHYEKYLAAAPEGRLAASAQRFMAGLKEQLDEEDARLAREAALNAKAEEARRAAEQAQREAQEAQAAHTEAMKRMQAELDQARQQAATAGPAGGPTGDTGTRGGSSSKRVIGTSLVALGGLALGWGIKSGLDARSAHGELDGLGMDDTWSQGYEWVQAHGERSQTRFIALSITGALLIGGGATLYYLGEKQAGRQPRERKPSVSVVPTLGPQGAGIQATGRF